MDQMVLDRKEPQPYYLFSFLLFSFIDKLCVKYDFKNYTNTVMI